MNNILSIVTLLRLRLGEGFTNH